MNRGTRWFIVVLVAFLVAGAASVVAAAAAIYRSGTISVEVEQANGAHVSLAVPAGAARAAIAWAPSVATEEWVEELGPYRSAIEAVAAELPRLPDCTLVEVRGPDRHVLVTKTGGLLLVHVREGDDRFRVEIPIDVLLSVAERLT